MHEEFRLPRWHTWVRNNFFNGFKLPSTWQVEIALVVLEVHSISLAVTQHWLGQSLIHLSRLLDCIFRAAREFFKYSRTVICIFVSSSFNHCSTLPSNANVETRFNSSSSWERIPFASIAFFTTRRRDLMLSKSFFRCVWMRSGCRDRLRISTSSSLEMK